LETEKGGRMIAFLIGFVSGIVVVIGAIAVLTVMHGDPTKDLDD